MWADAVTWLESREIYCESFIAKSWASTVLSRELVCIDGSTEEADGTGVSSEFYFRPYVKNLPKFILD